MLEGMAATGLPKDWRNALLLGRLGAGDDPSPVVENEPKLRLLAPCNLQCIKACGVTFAVAHVRTGHRRALGIVAPMRNLARRQLLPVPQ